MKRSEFLITHAATALVIAILILIVFRFTQRVERVTETPLVNLQNNVSTAPGGLVVALNKPTEQSKKHVLVNYVDQSGETVRTRQIPNATVETAQFQVVQDDVFVYTQQGDEPGLRRMDEEGSLVAMADIQPGNSSDSFWMISPDGTMIAWSDTSFIAPTTTSILYKARIDGSQQEQVAQLSGPGEFYLRPFAWIKDEANEWKIWYVRQPIGLGGYILFSDPFGPVYESGSTTLDQANIFTDVSQDGLIFAYLDHPEEQELTIHVVDFSLPLIGAGQAGEAKLSPDNSTVAVAVASGNPEQESGWVELWLVGSQASVRVTAEDPTQILRVVDWLDEETVVLSVLNADIYESDIYLVNKDGAFFRKIWTGYPIGVVPAP